MFGILEWPFASPCMVLFFFFFFFTVNDPNILDLTLIPRDLWQSTFSYYLRQLGWLETRIRDGGHLKWDSRIRDGGHFKWDSITTRPRGFGWVWYFDCLEHYVSVYAHLHTRIHKMIYNYHKKHFIRKILPIKTYKHIDMHNTVLWSCSICSIEQFHWKTRIVSGLNQILELSSAPLHVSLGYIILLLLYGPII